MSFKSKMKKRGNQKLNAFAKNPYHQEEKVKAFPTWGKILIPSLAAGAAAAILVVGFLPNMMNSSKAANLGVDSFNKGAEQGQAASQNNPFEPAQSAPAYTAAPIDYSYAPGQPSDGRYNDINWEERSIIQKYPYVNYLDNNYRPYNSSNNVTPIDDKYISNIILENVSLTGSDNEHTIEASIYNIKNIDDDAAVAVKFKDTFEYYAYVRLNYLVDSYDKLYDQFGFANELSLDSATYTKDNGQLTNRPIVNQDNLKALLTSYKGKSLNNIYPNDPDVPQNEDIQSVMVSFSIPCLDIKTANIEFYSYGLLSIRLSNAFPMQFNLGVAEYNTFKDTVMSSIG